MSADEIDTEVWALFEECQELSTSTGQLEAEATEYKAKLWDRENSDYPWVQNPYRELRAQMGWAEPRSAMGDVEKAKSRRQKWQQTKASLTREKAEAAEKVKMAEKTFTRENSYFDENLALRRGLAAAREPLEGAQRDLKRLEAQIKTLDSEAASWEEAKQSLADAEKERLARIEAERKKAEEKARRKAALAAQDAEGHQAPQAGVAIEAAGLEADGAAVERGRAVLIEAAVERDVVARPAVISVSEYWSDPEYSSDDEVVMICDYKPAVYEKACDIDRAEKAEYEPAEAAEVVVQSPEEIAAEAARKAEARRKEKAAAWKLREQAATEEFAREVEEWTANEERAAAAHAQHVASMKEDIADVTKEVVDVHTKCEEALEKVRAARAVVLQGEESYYQLLQEIMAANGVEWSPVTSIGLSGTDGLSVCQLHKEYEAVTELEEKHKAELQGAKEEVSALVANIYEMAIDADKENGMGLPLTIADLHYLEKNLERDYDYAGGHYEERKPTEFELKEEQRSLLKMARVHTNTVSAKTGLLLQQKQKLQTYIEKLTRTLFLDQDLAKVKDAMGADQGDKLQKDQKVKSFHKAAEKYVKASQPGLKLNGVRKPYKAYERVDGKFWVSDGGMCCRMFGTVNGRNDFVLGSGLQWGADGKLEA